MQTLIEIAWQHKTESSPYEAALYATLQLVSAVNQDTARSLHDSNAKKPFSSAMVDSNTLRIGILQDELLQLLVQGCAKKRVSDVRIIKQSSFYEMLQTVSSHSHIKISYITPTMFSRSHVRECGLSPALVFGSLKRRWEQNNGPSLPFLDFDKIVMTDYKLETKRVYFSNGKPAYEVGAIGHVVYYCPYPDIALYCHALASFAEYSGIGSRTTQGFGQVRYERS